MPSFLSDTKSVVLLTLGVAFAVVLWLLVRRVGYEKDDENEAP